MQQRENVRSRRRSRAGRPLIAFVPLVCLTACVGSVDRDEFDELVRERGGGLSGDLVTAGLEAIADETGEPDAQVYSITITATTVSYSLQSPDFDDEVDGWTYLLDGDLLGPTPESDLDDGETPITFAGSSIDIGTLEASIDAAVEQTSVRRGWAQSASLFAEPGGGFVLRVNITNERSDESFEFDGDGTLRSVS